MRGEPKFLRLGITPSLVPQLDNDAFTSLLLNLRFPREEDMTILILDSDLSSHIDLEFQEELKSEL